ncbi:4-hydroxy-3-methylbut-2-en-1-yl diphosphate synthase [candidate division WOR-3 bacterium JGI_Cruoil_03_51_56]|uniref:4-hydroxy-3-methylbut-2-en-1-yl diphosphate synthase (flavodoxin) n=1 Tax=candidate division WOR-3 bacterium JGI_Cruoil_03_51_56 TaxID=1973747 RepID=A0A235BUX1_UNCW3|nr:MAG: 4-hydroxy-3-methylbut-2-en-1-yl diphosphate synthase [candidate division WOR-3 bacterium JGI_Cruoil_03_51_56]
MVTMTKKVRVGHLVIGGGNPIVVQSMTKTRTDDVVSTVRQIRRLERAGCEMVRLAVPDKIAASALPEIRKRISLPLIADIHFDYRLALAAIRSGFDKIRINPGNIGAAWKVKEVIRAAMDRNVAIRVGVNAGSLDKRVVKKYGHPSVPAILESLEKALVPFEQLGFQSIILSAKTTSGPGTISVNQALSQRYPYPLHIGLTEAGLPFEGAVRSAATLGVLLNKGVGDTIRISLTGDPVLEVDAAYELLGSLGLRPHGPVVYACPTCGRTMIDVARLARDVKRALKGVRSPVRVAVMGCVVNGPGEAKEADYGIAGGKGKGVVFAHGTVIRTCAEDQLVAVLVDEIKRNAEG